MQQVVWLQLSARQKESQVTPHKQVAGLHRPAQQRHASWLYSGARSTKHSLDACLAPRTPFSHNCVYKAA